GCATGSATSKAAGYREIGRAGEGVGRRRGRAPYFARVSAGECECGGGWGCSRRREWGEWKCGRRKQICRSQTERLGLTGGEREGERRMDPAATERLVRFRPRVGQRVWTRGARRSWSIRRSGKSGGSGRIRGGGRGTRAARAGRSRRRTGRTGRWFWRWVWW